MSRTPSVPDGPDHSPSLLGRRRQRGAGVRRLNKVPILIVVGGLMLVAGAAGYTYRQRLLQSAAAAMQAATGAKPEPANGATVLASAPANGEVPATATKAEVKRQEGQRELGGVPASAATTPSDPSNHGSGGTEDRAAKARQQAWQAYYAEAQQVQKDHLSAAQSALTAETGLGNGQQVATPPRPRGMTEGAGSTLVPASASVGVPGSAQIPGDAGTGFGLPAYPPAQIDAAGQREKQAFLAQPGDVTGASDDLLAPLRDPSSPFLVMAGTAIPAVMVGGINSDMPGMVIGQVSENVYDTATGRYVLIPQGSHLIGRYDNSVSMGQTRVCVIWNRIIFPDTESIDLGSMEGADEGGYAGFHDQVNTHFWPKLGNALLISIASAGVQLSQPQAVNGQNYNSQQIAAAALGQQFAELGQEYARAGLSIPNTLEIRPGYRFTVMVNKDMHLRPYVDHRGTSIGGSVQIFH